MQSFSLFWTWWLAQLGALLPIKLIGAPAELPDAVILERDAQTISLLARRRGQEQRLSQVRADAPVGELGNALKASRGLPRLAVIRRPAAHVLRKSLVLPAAARRNLADLLGFEIDRETPFDRDEVHWTYIVRGQDVRTGMLDVDLILLPRSAVDTLVEFARELGLDAAGIEVGASNGATTLIPIGARVHGQWLDAQRPLMPLATAAAVLVLLAIATPFALQQWELAAVESRIAVLEPAAKQVAGVRQRAGEVAATVDFLTKERGKNGSALAALAAATNIVPDDSYLRRFSLRVGKVTLNGMSPSAAQLIGMLAVAPEFHEPAFDAPVTRDPGDELESFTISLALAQPTGAP